MFAAVLGAGLLALPGCHDRCCEERAVYREYSEGPYTNGPYYSENGTVVRENTPPNVTVIDEPSRTYDTNRTINTPGEDRRIDRPAPNNDSTPVK